MPSSTAASAIWAACSMNWEGRYHDDEGRARRANAGRERRGGARPSSRSRTLAYVTVWNIFHQVVKLCVADVDQTSMISAFKIQVGLLFEALINHGVQGVRRPDRWYRTNRAIGKNAADFVFGCQVDGAL